MREKLGFLTNGDGLPPIFLGYDHPGGFFLEIPEELKDSGIHWLADPLGVLSFSPQSEEDVEKEKESNEKWAGFKSIGRFRIEGGWGVIRMGEIDGKLILLIPERLKSHPNLRFYNPKSL